MTRTGKSLVFSFVVLISIIFVVDGDTLTSRIPLTDVPFVFENEASYTNTAQLKTWIEGGCWHNNVDATKRTLANIWIRGAKQMELGSLSDREYYYRILGKNNNTNKEVCIYAWQNDYNNQNKHRNEQCHPKLLQLDGAGKTFVVLFVDDNDFAVHGKCYRPKDTSKTYPMVGSMCKLPEYLKANTTCT